MDSLTDITVITGTQNDRNHRWSDVSVLYFEVLVWPKVPFANTKGAGPIYIILCVYGSAQLHNAPLITNC